MTVDEAIKFCIEKAKNIKLRTEPETFIQITGMLEELERIRDSKGEHIRKEYIVNGKKCVFYFDEYNTCRCSEEVIDMLIGFYNIAIDDFTKALCSNEVIDKSVVRRCATQLKGSAE